MADTQRSVATLQGLLADNTVGAISAQDVRDMLVSMTPDQGECYVSATANTVIATPGTYVKVAGTTTLVSGGRNFTMPANGRLTFGGDTQRRALVIANLSVSISVASQDMCFKIYNSGVAEDASETWRYMASTNVLVGVQVTGMVNLDPTDYIEVYATAMSGICNILAGYMQLIVITWPV